MSSIQLEEQGMATAEPESVVITVPSSDSELYTGASPLHWPFSDYPGRDAIPDFDLECPEDFMGMGGLQYTDGPALCADPRVQTKRKRSTNHEGRVREGGPWSLPKTSPLQVATMQVLPPQPQPAAHQSQPAAQQPQPGAPQPQHAAPQPHPAAPHPHPASPQQLQQHELDVARQWLDGATVRMIPPEKKERQASNCKVIDKICHVKPKGYFRLDISGNLRHLYARVSVVFKDEDSRDTELLSCNMHWKKHTDKCSYNHALENAFCCSKTLSVFSKVADLSNSQRCMEELTSLWNSNDATRDANEIGKKKITISAICWNSCSPDGNKEGAKRSTLMIVELVAVSPATGALLDIKPKVFKFEIICCQAPTRDSKAKHLAEKSGYTFFRPVKKEPIVKKEPPSVDTVPAVGLPHSLPLSYGVSRELASPMYPLNMPIIRYQIEVETRDDQTLHTALAQLGQLPGFRVKQVLGLRPLYSASDSPL